MNLNNKKTFTEEILYRIKYRNSFNNFRASNILLSEDENSWLQSLKDDGFAKIENLVPDHLLKEMQNQLQIQLEDLNFESPCFGQSLVNKSIHNDLIENHFLLDGAGLVARNLSFSSNDVDSLSNALSKYEPSTLTVNMLKYSEQYLMLWLDERLLKVISTYMGLVPKLVEAYVRRNFPAKYKTMNHYWHRDLNHKHYLLKVFFFLSDCEIENGPHEFIKGSHKDFSFFNNKRYFSDSEVDKIYLPNSFERKVEFIKAGTILIEDTRGLHRARVPIKGHRDLGYAVFSPPVDGINYTVSKASFDNLSIFQKMFMPTNPF